MEIIIIFAIVIVAFALYMQYTNSTKSTESTKVEEVAKEVVAEVKAEVTAVKEVAKKTTARAKKALDVNQDGKVNLKDAVDGAKAVKAKVTKAKPKAS
jgi:hypothetical protein